jgi:DNA-binding NarL/FixJ family response regulator
VRHLERRRDELLRITPWERDALQLLADGSAVRDLAGRLRVQERDVDAHLASLFRRMGATNRSEAVAAAYRRGLLRVGDVKVPRS